MKRILLLLLLLAGPAIAADNSVILTPGVGVTMRTRDVGSGVQSQQMILGDTSGNSILGTAASPNSNVITVQGIANGTPLTISGSNLTNNITQWASTTLGAPTAWGIAPSGNVIGVNANVINVNSNGQATMANSSPVVIASNQSTITVSNLSLGIVGSTAPTTAGLSGAQSGANIVGIIQADTTKQISMSSATTTQMVALSGSTKIYATSYDVIAGGTTNVTFVYGTGSNCGTGTTSLAGLYALTAQAGISKGSGLGPVLVVPAGNALCVVNSAAVLIGGSLSYTQF